MKPVSSRDQVYIAGSGKRTSGKNSRANSFLGESGKESRDVSQCAAGRVEAGSGGTEEREVKQAMACRRLARDLKQQPKQLQTDPSKNKNEEIGESCKESSRKQTQQACPCGDFKRAMRIRQHGFPATVKERGPL